MTKTPFSTHRDFIQKPQYVSACTVIAPTLCTTCQGSLWCRTVCASTLRTLYTMFQSTHQREHKLANGIPSTLPQVHEYSNLTGLRNYVENVGTKRICARVNERADGCSDRVAPGHTRYGLTLCLNQLLVTTSI